jgi:multidrug efflux pump subunit AcrA (membrane-fusion protein)
VPVEVLFYTGERVAVRAGRLEPGELVVVEGNERLYPSAPVAPIESVAPIDPVAPIEKGAR